MEENSEQLENILKILQNKSFLSNQQHKIELMDGLIQLKHLKTSIREDQRNEILQKICNCLEYQFFSKGEFIQHHGDKCTHLFIVIKGRPSIWIHKSEEDLNQEINLLAKLVQYKQKLETSEMDIDRKFWLQKIERCELNLNMLRNQEEDNMMRQSQKKYFQLQNVCRFKKIATLGSGDAIGEANIITDKQFTQQTVLALEDTHIIQVTKQDYHNIFELERQRLQQIIDTMQKYFPNAKYLSLKQLAYNCTEEFYNYRAPIFEEGSQADKFFIIKLGQIEIQKNYFYDSNKIKREDEPNNGNINEQQTMKARVLQQPMRLDLINQGMAFGFEDFFEVDQKRSYSALSISSDTVLYGITRKVIDEVIQYQEDEKLGQDLQQKSSLKSNWNQQRIEKSIVYQKQEENNQTFAAQQHQVKKMIDQSDYKDNKQLKDIITQVLQHKIYSKEQRNINKNSNSQVQQIQQQMNQNMPKSVKRIQFASHNNNVQSYQQPSSVLVSPRSNSIQKQTQQYIQSANQSPQHSLNSSQQNFFGPISPQFSKTISPKNSTSNNNSNGDVFNFNINESTLQSKLQQLKQQQDLINNSQYNKNNLEVRKNSIIEQKRQQRMSIYKKKLIQNWGKQMMQQSKIQQIVDNNMKVIQNKQVSTLQISPFLFEDNEKNYELTRKRKIFQMQRVYSNKDRINLNQKKDVKVDKSYLNRLKSQNLISLDSYVDLQDNIQQNICIKQNPKIIQSKLQTNYNSQVCDEDDDEEQEKCIINIQQIQNQHQDLLNYYKAKQQQKFLSLQTEQDQVKKSTTMNQFTERQSTIVPMPSFQTHDQRNIYSLSTERRQIQKQLTQQYNNSNNSKPFLKDNIIYRKQIYYPKTQNDFFSNNSKNKKIITSYSTTIKSQPQSPDSFKQKINNVQCNDFKLDNL